MKKILVLSFLFFLFYSCSEKELSDLQNRYDDSVFLSNVSEDIHIRPDVINPENYDVQTINIYDKIFIQAYISENSKKNKDGLTGNWFFFIKEINKKNTNRFFIELDDKFLYYTPDYDSLQYDFYLIVNDSYRSYEDINDLLLLKNNFFLLDKNTIQYKDSLSANFNKIKNIYIRQFSSKILRIPEIRNNDTNFEERFLDANDIKEVEKVINGLIFFDNFDFKNISQLNTLKYLLIITQIKPLTLNSYNYNEDIYYDEYRFLFNTSGVFEISSETVFENFKNSMKDSVMWSNILNPIARNWGLENFKFIETLIPQIEKDYLNENVFYFYTLNDMKLFRFEISLNNGYIELKKDHLNKQFLMFDQNRGVP